jgi:hypothetical protein
MNTPTPASLPVRAEAPGDGTASRDAPAPERPYPNLVADTLRGSVRCAFPLSSLVALSGLLFSDQGRDVLRALVGAATDPMQGNAIGGLVFLWAAAALLSASIWYSMRWLLAANMLGLPLPLQAGPAQKWVPRLTAGAAPAMIALGLWSLQRGKVPLQGAVADTATHAAWWFAGLAVALVVAYAWRGELLLKLRQNDWVDSDTARAGSQPGTLAAHEPLAPVTLRIIVWSLLFSAALALLFFLFPVTLSRVVGAAAVAALALASINLFGSFVLTWWPLRRGLPPLATVLVLLAGLVFSLFNDNHKVRPADSARDGPVVDTPVAHDAGLAAFIAANPAKDNEGKPLVLFVASEGGGIRAAYWTAAVLDALSAKQPLFTQQLFALSGVSGGSLGAATWLASQRGQWCDPASPSSKASALSFSGMAPSARVALGPDFVSPALAGLFYADLMQRFLPFPVAAFDRSRGIEEAWQRAFAHLPGEPLAQPLSALYQGCKRPLPHLLLNATRVETGQRVVLSRLPAALFNNTFDAMVPGSLAQRQSLAGLVHHSARFPLVSPAGTVKIDGTATGVPPAFRLVDGGYFDNSGVETALDLILALKKRSPDLPFHPVLLLVRNEASPLAAQDANNHAPAAWFPETGSILSALLNARSSHAVTARAAALRALDDNDIIDMVVPVGTPAAAAPLGWALSAQVRRTLDVAAVAVADCAARLLEDRVGGHAPSCKTSP